MEVCKVIILLGPPGSGKGTCASSINKNFGFKHVSTGDILRDVCKSNTEEGIKIKNIIDKGELVSDDIVLKLIFDFIISNSTCKGFMFDGFPRTVIQADGLNKILQENGLCISKVISFEVELNKLIDRICGRLMHTNSGRVYHVVNNPPKIPFKDDITGEDLIRRDDDKEDVLRNRIEKYSQNTEPLIKYYKEKGLLDTINANEDIEVVEKQILAKIEQIF